MDACICVYMCVYVCDTCGRLGRRRDTCDRLVGGGVTRAADWWGRGVRRAADWGDEGGAFQWIFIGFEGFMRVYVFICVYKCL